MKKNSNIIGWAFDKAGNVKLVSAPVSAADYSKNSKESIEMAAMRMAVSPLAAASSYVKKY